MNFFFVMPFRWVSAVCPRTEIYVINLMTETVQDRKDGLVRVLMVCHVVGTKPTQASTFLWQVFEPS